MAGYDEELSKQYHSLRFYYGVYDTVNVNYRIGNSSRVIADESERFYDTWQDFRLIPTERPTVTLPKHNSKLISVPGRVTPLNFSNYLTGHPTFANRSGSWNFYCDNDYIAKKGGFVAYQKFIHECLHGRVRKIVLRDDPGYFYVGELTVGQLNPGQDRSTISISYNVYPYKKATISSMDMWKFDDFDFRDGVIQYLKDMTVDSSQRIVDVYGSPERISPHISGSSGMQIDKLENNNWVSYGNVPTDSIEKQSTIIPRLVIGEGVNRLRFRNNGTVTIDYRRGLL